jgi:FkbM family methyltransferase
MFKKILLKALNNAGYLVQKREFMAFGIDHAVDIGRFRKDSKQVRIIFDVGANIGQTALSYLKNFPDAEIFSFEPISETFQQLRANVYGKSGVKCFNLAMGRESGSIQVQLQSCSLFNSLSNKGNYATGRAEIVRVVSLDEFLEEKQIPHIDILKIDAEGFDLEVLKGGTKFLQSAKDVFLYIETTFRREDNDHTNFDEIHSFIYDYGFRFVGIYDQDYNSFAPPLPPLAYCNALFHKK